MAKKKIFISSVQGEFAAERRALHEYILADPLLGKFFEPFLFELLPALDRQVDVVYLKAVEHCDIYLGLLGTQYGFETASGLSPTELEFDHATKLHKTRLVFLSEADDDQRHPKETIFIRKAQSLLVRKSFASIDELKAAVYASLVRYLEDKEIIRTGPFDATLSEKATFDDLDTEKIQSFVRQARAKRGFPLGETDGIERILTHLNLLEGNRLTHAAILLFGKAPQRFFINSEVRCASFHGTIVEKPIPSYKVFKGTVFELVEQVVDFILSKLDYSIGTRAESVSIPGAYEIPREIITEATVNSICHRDYTSNASVQVMLFRDRIEVWNPGSLPLGWTTEKLKQLHTSVPANPLLAEPMYLAGYIERLGTGTSDMVRRAKDAGLDEPDFIQSEDFRTVIYRPVRQATDQVTVQDTDQDTDQVTDQVKKLILNLEGMSTREDLMTTLGLSHNPTFRKNYIFPAIGTGLIEMTIPDKPNSRNQRYRLTAKGKALQQRLNRK